jgi:hypothetical protein
LQINKPWIEIHGGLKELKELISHGGLKSTAATSVVPTGLPRTVPLCPLRFLCGTLCPYRNQNQSQETED